MLNKLYQKLYIIFISSMMLIITAVIGVLYINSVDNEQRVNSTFFGRLATLMIYELENPKNHPRKVIQPYESSYSIFALLTDPQGNVIYESAISFPTDKNLLIDRFSERSNTESTTVLQQTSATTQGGIITISGISHDTYWGIPATIVDKDGSLFHLYLLQQNKISFELIKKQLFFYILIWLISLLCVTSISHFLLK